MPQGAPRADKKLDSEVVTELSRKAISKGLNVRLKADGISMFPYIWPREMVTFRPMGKDEEPRDGSMLVIDRGPGFEFLLHRKTGRQGDKLITRGDSVEHDDTPWRRDQVLGVVTHVEGRFTHKRRRVPDRGGMYWMALRAAAPLSYKVNGIVARCAILVMRALRGLTGRR